MDAKKGKTVPAWLAIACCELSHIRETLCLTSDRAFARAVRMNPRTISKLRPESPDASVKYETVVHLFLQLGVFLQMDGLDQSEEYFRVSDAMFRIHRAYSRHPCTCFSSKEEGK